MAQITILNDQKVPEGPFTRDQVAAKLQAGTYTLDSWAFIDGLAQWTPLRDVLARVDAPAPPPAVAAAAPIPAATTSFPPSSAPPSYSYAATMAPPSHLIYAGFWLRFVAIFIDGLILSPLAIVSVILQISIQHSQDDSTQVGLLTIFGLLYSLVALVIRWLYFALMESSAWQATLGKKILGIQVTGLDGRRIGFGRATGRFFGKFISALILSIGFIMAGFTERKQALHDMIAGTLVVRK
jgi:uncharacterized RDD family membrane protein YckC